MPSENEALIEALGPREVIGQAVGMLMTRHNVDEAAAFEMLVQESSDSHENVREIAATIVRQRSADSSG